MVKLVIARVVIARNVVTKQCHCEGSEANPSPYFQNLKGSSIGTLFLYSA
jgi:hypothetical protein